MHNPFAEPVGIGTIGMRIACAESLCSPRPLITSWTRPSPERARMASKGSSKEEAISQACRRRSVTAGDCFVNCFTRIICLEVRTLNIDVAVCGIEYRPNSIVEDRSCFALERLALKDDPGWKVLTLPPNGLTSTLSRRRGLSSW